MMVKIGFVAIAVTPDWCKTLDKRSTLEVKSKGFETVSKQNACMFKVHSRHRRVSASSVSEQQTVRVMSEVRLRLVEGPTLFIREPRLDPGWVRLVRGLGSGLGSSKGSRVQVNVKMRRVKVTVRARIKVRVRVRVWGLG
jgi:hypothetical protein